MTSFGGHVMTSFGGHVRLRPLSSPNIRNLLAGRELERRRASFVSQS